MPRIVLELSDEEASIVYRALVEQFKEWVFGRLEKGRRRRERQNAKTRRGSGIPP